MNAAEEERYRALEADRLELSEKVEALSFKNRDLLSGIRQALDFFISDDSIAAAFKAQKVLEALIKPVSTQGESVGADEMYRRHAHE